MVDANSRPLDQFVFGWRDDEAHVWREPSRALQSQIVRAIRFESEPFWVNECGFWPDNANPRLRRIGLFTFTEFTHANAAIVVPVHMPLGQIGVGVFTHRDPQQADLSIEYVEISEALSCYVRAICIGYEQLRQDRRYQPDDVVLTPQEVKCLKWAAFGKTDTEVAQILDCSHGTVRYHITNVMRKLDATTRSQCVFKATQLGFLGAVD